MCVWVCVGVCECMDVENGGSDESNPVRIELYLDQALRPGIFLFCCLFLFRRIHAGQPY